MISPVRDMESHFEAGRKRAMVCSIPPSEVGTGIVASDCVSREPAWVADEDSDNGRKYRYICVVKRLGILIGVTQRVNGINLSSRHK